LMRQILGPDERRIRRPTRLYSTSKQNVISIIVALFAELRLSLPWRAGTVCVGVMNRGPECKFE
jgi:hypothetical protein